MGAGDPDPVGVRDGDPDRDGAVSVGSVVDGVGDGEGREPGGSVLGDVVSSAESSAESSADPEPVSGGKKTTGCRSCGPPKWAPGDPVGGGGSPSSAERSGPVPGCAGRRRLSAGPSRPLRPPFTVTSGEPASRLAVSSGSPGMRSRMPDSSPSGGGGAARVFGGPAAPLPGGEGPRSVAIGEVEGS